MIATICVWLALLAPTSGGQDAARGAAERVLERLAPGARRSLQCAIVRWHERQVAGQPSPGPGFVAALRHPDAFRLEVKPAAGEGYVLRRSAGSAWLTAGGSSVEIEKPNQHESQHLFLLLGSLLAWDLMDPPQPPRLDNGELVSTASWLDASTPVTVRRRLAADGSVAELRLGETSYRLETGEGAGSRVTRVIGPEGTRELDLLELGVVLQQDYFAAPRDASAGAASIVRGGEKRNFKSPRLERQPPAWVIETDDPGTWAKRFEILDAIGRELHGLGHLPVGLPAFTDEGRLLVAYAPPSGKEADPDVTGRPKPSRRSEAVIAVLYVEATWEQAREILTAKLLQHVQTLGLRQQGRIRFIPYLIPGESPPPAADAKIVVRGEVVVR